jgi:hypothetical protein
LSRFSWHPLITKRIYSQSACILIDLSSRSWNRLLLSKLTNLLKHCFKGISSMIPVCKNLPQSCKLDIHGILFLFLGDAYIKFDLRSDLVMVRQYFHFGNTT